MVLVAVAVENRIVPHGVMPILPRIWHPLVPRAETFLNLDVGETGIGEGSCGEIPLEKYRLKAREMSWRIDIEPIFDAEIAGVRTLVTRRFGRYESLGVRKL